jgi:hypothetical protein
MEHPFKPCSEGHKDTLAQLGSELSLRQLNATDICLLHSIQKAKGEDKVVMFRA